MRQSSFKKSKDNSGGYYDITDIRKELEEYITNKIKSTNTCVICTLIVTTSV